MNFREKLRNLDKAIVVGAALTLAGCSGGGYYMDDPASIARAQRIQRKTNQFFGIGGGIIARDPSNNLSLRERTVLDVASDVLRNNPGETTNNINVNINREPKSKRIENQDVTEGFEEYYFASAIWSQKPEETRTRVFDVDETFFVTGEITRNVDMVARRPCGVNFDVYDSEGNVVYHNIDFVKRPTGQLFQGVRFDPGYLEEGTYRAVWMTNFTDNTLGELEFEVRNLSDGLSLKE